MTTYKLICEQDGTKKEVCGNIKGEDRSHLLQAMIKQYYGVKVHEFKYAGDRMCFEVEQY